MIGNQPAAGVGSISIANDSFNGTGAATSFTLSQTVGATTDIEVIVDNVQQSPYDGSYSVSGTTLTFSGAPAAGTNNIYVIYNNARTITTQQQIPDDGSVTHSKFHTTALNPITLDQTNNRVGIGTASPTSALHISGGAGTNIGIQSSAGTHWRVGDGVGSTNGNLVIYDYTDSRKVLELDTNGNVTKPNQPSFLMKKYSGGSTAISVNSAWTFDEALSNVGNHANISNGRFTAPVTGSYCFMWHNIGEGTSTVYRSFIRKNGSSTWGTGSYRLESRNYHSAGYPNASAQVVVQLNASDYVDIYLEGGSIYSDTTNGVWFCGFLIG